MADWRLDQVGRALDDEAREEQDRPLSAGDRPVPRPSAGGPGRTGGSGRLLRPLAIGLLAVAGAGIGYAAFQAFQGDQASVSPEDVPLIRADRSPVRIQPEQPGGLEVPHQDRLVMNDEAGEGPPTTVESVRPPPEQPLAAAPAQEPAPDGPSAAGEQTAAREVPPSPPSVQETEGDDPIAALLEADQAGRSGGELTAGPETAAPAEPMPAAQPDAAAPAPPPETAPVETGTPDPAPQFAAAPGSADDGTGEEIEALIPRREAGASPDETSTETPAELAAPAEAPAEAPASPAVTEPPRAQPADAGDGTAVETAPPRAQPADAGAGPADADAAPEVAAETDADGLPPSGMETGLRDLLGGEAVDADGALDMVTALTQSEPEGDGPLAFAPPAPGLALDLPPPGSAPIANPRLAEIDLPDDFDTSLPAPPAGPPEQEPAEVAARDGSVQFLPDPNGTHRVQIVAVQAQDEIVPKWNQLVGDHPQLLSALERHVEPVDLGARGIWYRVQAGPLSAARADALCDTLKARGTDCIVRRR
ncbi:MAG: hypothetical protein GVY13_15865 [Alphaproteobacteria bacterium]|jgi:hypothetical protein|nr:hypothetical protein [Alphaproteobacteria bacterium]